MRGIATATVTTIAVDFNRNLGTRNRCIAILILSWLCALAAIGYSAYLIHLSVGGPELRWLAVRLNSLAVDFVALGLSIFVTLLNEGLGYIHTASLRWSLHQERRLNFNTNLRLFSCSHSSAVNGRISNTVMLFCIVLVYSTPSLLLSPVAYGGDPTNGAPNNLDNTAELNAITLLFLGIAIFGQATIATWALFSSSQKIVTWSSNPLETVKACLQSGTLYHRPDRCMLSVKDADTPAKPTRPAPKQPSMLSSHREVRRVVLLMWSLIPLGAVWFVVVYYFVFIWGVQQYGPSSGGQPHNWSPIPTTSSAPYTIWSWRWAQMDQVNTALAAIAFVSTLQGILTLILHCVELIVNLHRDERWWRTATSHRGCLNSNYDSISQALISWPTALLFLFKAIIHWFFGLSLKKFFDPNQALPFLRFRPMQILYLTVITLVLVVIMSMVAFRSPRGPQPAAYGHLQTLADCVDEWTATGDFWWGHKWEGDVVSHAGTADRKLGNVKMDSLYS